MISSEEEAEIIRLYYAEKWKLGTIATYLARHYSAVRRVILGHELNTVEVQKRKRSSILSNYEYFIRETLQKYPLIPSSRIFQMLKERGYSGRSQGLVRQHVTVLRPAKNHEAFLRLKTLPGEEAQVDWAEFGKVQVGEGTRKLSGFVMTLSYSRVIFLKFFYSQEMRAFLQGFVESFEFFNGVPRKILLDNLRTGVTNREGPYIKYNEQFLSLSKHYHFEPQAVGVRKGNQKGRVERSIQYIRSNFFSGREFKNIDILNKEAMQWCLEISPKRPWQQDPLRRVHEVYEEERPKLLNLPNTHFICLERKIVSIGKTPYARFDLNDYSVPAKYVMKKLEICASENFVEIHDGPTKIAEHFRSYGRREVIEDNAHIVDLLKQKKRAVQGSALHRLLSLVPDTKDFIEILINRGENTGGVISSLTKMLNTYGNELLTEAIQEVVVHDSPKLKSLHFSLKRLEEQKKDELQNIPIIEMKTDKFANIVVEHHKTSHYDKITGIKK